MTRSNTFIFQIAGSSLLLFCAIANCVNLAHISCQWLSPPSATKAVEKSHFKYAKLFTDTGLKLAS
jgi:hypothetical protein